MPLLQRALLHSEREAGKKFCIFLAPITDEQYEDLVNNKQILLEHKDRTFRISPDSAIIYGSLDFNSKEVQELAAKRILKLTGNDGISDNCPMIPADYDYETHTCKTTIGRYRSKEIGTSITELLKFAHGTIGKPETIIMFRTNMSW